MYNLLTYNQLTVENMWYACDTPFYTKESREKRLNKITSNKIHLIPHHITHNKVFEEGKGSHVKCIPTPTSKFERIIDKPLENLCFIEKASESKGVVLYYPFISLKQRLLFFKLERDQMLSVGHIDKALKTYVGNPLDKHLGTNFGVKEVPKKGKDLETGLDMRREDRGNVKYKEECDYQEYFYRKDIIFYKNYYKILGLKKKLKLEEDFLNEKFEKDYKELTWYNENVRTGCEFYVTKNLLIVMFMYLLAPEKTLKFSSLTMKSS